MTTVFINQRFKIMKQRALANRLLLYIVITMATVLLQLAVVALSGQMSGNWLFIYMVTITVLVIWDRVAKRMKHPH